MFAAFPLHKSRQGALFLFTLLLLFAFLVFVSLLLLSFSPLVFPYYAPSGFKNLFTRYLELDAIDFSQDRGSREFTVGQENPDKAPCHQVENLLLGIAEVLGNDACGDDGMVVGDFRRVEDAFGLL